VLVIDACGVGALPDADAYGDAGTNTLAHLAQALGGLRLPVLGSLGLGSIVEIEGVQPSADPAIFGRLHALGPGKDSISGHWELMGVVSERALPTYPQGFPQQLLAQLQAATGHALICNRPDNGLAAIEQFGAEQLRTGALILYTSQDSVLQLAAHVERVPVAELYRACAAARAVMSGEHAVGRVIARPFAGEPGAFVRTQGRRDFALEPPARSYLQELEAAGVQVHGVGKVVDLFAGVGVSVAHAGATNASALDAVAELQGSLQRGLVFANLIETDQLYGHRKDAEGFARALREIDARVGRMLAALREGDLLIVTADHGVDLQHPGTDHTREYAPLLAVSGAMLARRGAGSGEGGAGSGGAGGGLGAGSAGSGLGGARHDGPLADVGASVLRWLTGSEGQGLPGEAFIS
jgi:phosphopentomutase